MHPKNSNSYNTHCDFNIFASMNEIDFYFLGGGGVLSDLLVQGLEEDSVHQSRKNPCRVAGTTWTVLKNRHTLK